MKRGIKIAGVALAATLLLAGCAGDESLEKSWNKAGDNGFVAGDGSTTSFPVDSRQSAPEFSGVDTTGKDVKNTDFTGSVTVVNFWYAGCAPCRTEIKELIAAYDVFHEQGVKFLGVNTRDQQAQAHGFEQEFKVQYPSIVDMSGDRKAQRAFAGKVPLNAVPTTLVLDKQGRVAHRIVGQINSKSQLETLIKETLAEK